VLEGDCDRRVLRQLLIDGTKMLIARNVLVLYAAAPAVNLRVTGGEVPGGSSLAPKIGPLGLVRARAFLPCGVRAQGIPC